MARKACRECYEAIDRRATRCPHCRAKQGGGGGILGKALLAFLLLMGVLPLLSTNTVSTPTPARRSPVATRPTQAVARPAVAKPEPPKTRRGEPAPSADQPLIVPTDPKARYFILEKGGTQRRPTLVTKRIGPSGTSFSKKEFDCSTGTFRYLGDGDTLEEMRRSAPEPSMAPLVEGSISYYHWRHACRA